MVDRLWSDSLWVEEDPQLVSLGGTVNDALGGSNRLGQQLARVQLARSDSINNNTH